jgi:hypothetical protein
MLASGVVWKEAPESAIYSVRTGGVGPMVPKACIGIVGIHPLC